jgi:hypothetical protein
LLLLGLTQAYLVYNYKLFSTVDVSRYTHICIRVRVGICMHGAHAQTSQMTSIGSKRSKRRQWVYGY